MYQGWSDPNISPLNTVHYYQSVLKTMGEAANDSVRLFLFPGMGHCGGGDGPNTFDAMGALAQWVEKGKPPDQLLASHRAKRRRGSHAAHLRVPKVAAYKGTGSIDEAGNFACQAR